MTKFEKETTHRIYVFILKKKKKHKKKKTLVNSGKCETIARGYDAFCPLTQA